jgi:hypothetical protein
MLREKKTMGNSALANNTWLEAFSPLKESLSPISLNVALSNNGKLTLKK